MSENHLRNSKRPHEDNLANEQPAMRMMRLHGYKKGQGLGAHGQGVVEPIALSTQKDRRGLGSSTIQSGSKESISMSSDPELVWSQGCDEALPDNDRIWKWCHPDVSSAMEQLPDLLIPHDSDEALGPPIKEMLTQCQFCSSHLVTELLAYKNQLDQITKFNVTESHQRSNPYELIKNGIFMNRAAMKMANLDASLNGMISKAAHETSTLYFADVCAGPGGFSEYLLWRRCNAPLGAFKEGWESDTNFILNNPPNLVAKGFGLTLIGECDFRESDFLAGPPEAFYAHYGSSRDGDITKWCNLASFAALVDQATEGAGVRILMADGGFDVSGQENLQEVLSKRIYLCQCLCALINLQRGGHFITKLFDVLTEFTVGLIYLMSHVFEEIMIVKPVTSRPANSERYLVCKRFLSPAQGMAGCPAPPKSNSSSLQMSPSSEPQSKAHKLPGHGRLIIKSNPKSKRSESDKVWGRLDRERTGPVGALIQHFLLVNEEIGRLQSSIPNFASTAQFRPVDLVRLCPYESLDQDHSFMNFIITMNEDFAKTQCIALSKLLAFTQDHKLVDPRQQELKRDCLIQWKIKGESRISVAWPIKHSAIIRNLLGDSDRANLLKPLPREYGLSERLLTFTQQLCNSFDETLRNCQAVVCGAPRISNLEESKPLWIYSGGSKRSGIWSFNGNKWNEFEGLNPRLPAGTLVWAQQTREYNLNKNMRQYVLTILDVACIYGDDCRHLVYQERMALARKMADIVNFPGMKDMVIRVPELLNLRDLSGYVEKLEYTACKDYPSGCPMYRYPDGMAYKPHSLLLVKYLADPQRQTICDSNGSPIKNVITDVTKTRFIEIPWTIDNRSNLVSATEFIKRLEH